ncbi:alpha/beta hydrolase [Aquimarina agarilytica]|uniref:alpha/beta hydrolase n=1 Tax=Aquimarina agarilytica TaxID=1087449 RepID=UPI0002897B5A|nr:alpha/beta hydrolase [Aquimarina agarilytica]
MKEKLIIISDLWGTEKTEWIINYTKILKTKFDITFYNSCELGKIDKSNYNQNSLHRQFITGGIEIAVDRLAILEKHPITILAFSIGGTIAWKFGIKSKKIKTLICVSSTRLRKETERPNGKLALYFGEKDEFKPTTEWLSTMALEYKIISNKGHLLYHEPKFAKLVSNKLLKMLSQ